MIRLQPISNVLGVLLILLGGLMLACLPFSYYYHEGDSHALIVSGLLTITIGGLSWLYKFKGEASLNRREGYLVVALGWLGMALFSTLPFLFSGVIESFGDALFESISGLTTTGATILTDIEAVPKGILFWRSLTQWIGGMGIIVLTVAIFPLLGIAGIELFQAEAPGPTSDKIHPRIRETAKRLWLIYVSLTAVLCVILFSSGMSFYDAINHALTTMATGGFSTKNASIAHFNSPLIEYEITAFMLIAGTNYTVIYWGLKRRFKRVFQSEEFRLYGTVVLGASFLIGASVFYLHEFGLEESFRVALFQVASIVTTTGYVTADYTSWSPGLTTIFFVLLFVGACAGSTSGGIKLIRHLVFLKNSYLEFNRILHPRGVIRIKIDKNIVAPRILTHILVFLLIYLGIFVIGTIVVTALGMDFVSASGAVATSLGNVGPGIGDVGPVHNFAQVPSAAKIFLAFIMLLGRLELFTILVLFTPYFWKN